jgi:hypothetical protein
MLAVSVRRGFEASCMTSFRQGPLLDPLPPDERLSEEDMAARREAEFLADSLAVQKLRAHGGDVIERGVCSNCGGVCLPRAVYCDEDCRSDHEARLRQLARRGVCD